jgi:hypothetical protein
MTELRVPRWIITQMMMPSGRRSGKKPVFQFLTSTWLPPERHVPVYALTKNGYEPTEIPGLFERWEYRFWAMVVFSGATQMVAECRCCGHIGVNDLVTRRQHPSKGGCTKRLLHAYKLLQRDQRCVICDGHTTTEKWGVPLCSSGCQQAWCENEAQPSSLTQALGLLEEAY